MRKIADLDVTMSRRQWMWVAGLGSLGLSMGLKANALTSGLGAAEPAVDPLAAIEDTVASIYDSEPDLKGFGVASLVTSAAFAGRSQEEMDLLAGRIYYQALERLNKAAQEGTNTDFSWEEIHGVLSSPPNTDSLSKEYFDHLLADTKAKVEADSRFAAIITDSAAQARRRDRERPECFDGNGDKIPCWMFWLVAAVIIIGGLLLIFL